MKEAKTTRREEILQKLYNLLRDSSTYTILFHQAVADHVGLNITDHKCLNFLAQLGPLTAGELAELSGLTTGAITGVIDRLEKAGYVRRERDPSDRRSVIVRMVAEKVQENLVPVFDVLTRKTAPIFSNYTDQELETVLRFNKDSIEVMKAAIADIRAGKV